MAQTYSKHNIRSLFLKLLPAQIFSQVTSSLSGIVNGFVVGKYLSAIDMVALGFATPLTMLNTVVATIVSSGARIVCGEYIGRGDKKKINETLTVSVFVLFAIGAIMTFAGLTFANPIVKLIGASESAIPLAATYIRGISIGIIPTVISPCLMVFLQMENDSTYALLSTVVLAVVNYILSMFAMKNLGANMFIVGLMTSISQFVLFAMLCLRYIFKKNLPGLEKTSNIKLAKEIVVVGLPSALAIFLYNIRNTLLNTFALQIYGEPAVQALAILGSTAGPYDSFNSGVSSTLLMLASVYIGEKDRDSIKQVVRTSISVGLVIGFIKVAFIVLFVDKIALLYGANHEVLDLTKSLYINYSLSAPLNMITVSLTGTEQALKRLTYVNIITVLTALIIPIAYILIAKGIIGILTVWSCYWVSEVITLLIMYFVSCSKKKGTVHGVGDILRIEESINLETSKTISIKKIEEVVNVSREVQLFCEEYGISKKKAMIAGLCLEEMAANIIEHGFSKCKKTKDKVIDIYVGIDGENVNMRIKDNAVAFDPHIKLNNDDPTKNIGIKMVSKLAKQMTYQNTFGLNVLAITL